MKKILILLLGLFIYTTGSAQQEKGISIGYEGMSFVELTQELESKYQIQAFFDEVWVKDIVLKKAYSNISLDSLIGDIFNQSKINFIIRDNIVILTKFDNLKQEFSFNVSHTEAKIDKQEVDIKEVDFSALQQQEYIIHEIGVALGRKKAKVFGKLSLFGTNIPLKGVEIFLPSMKKGVTSDKDGYFELELEQGPYSLNFRHLGLKQTVRKINLRGEGRLNVQMRKETQAIKEIKVFAKDNKVKRTSMGLEYFASKDFESLPSALGEPDIIKSTTMLPAGQKHSKFQDTLSIFVI